MTYGQLKKMVIYQIGHYDNYSQYYLNYTCFGIPTPTSSYRIKLKHAVQCVRASFKPNPYLQLATKKDIET